MGRYTSVQAYADNNANARSISYQQAKGEQANNNSSSSGGGQKASSSAVTAEKIVNPYGSTAGSGSGDFHVYRHARAREAARIHHLQVQREDHDKEAAFVREWQQAQTEEERKTAKRRLKRQREKTAKLRRKNLQAAGIRLGAGGSAAAAASESGGATNKATDEEEFNYIPLAEQKKKEEQQEETKGLKEAPTSKSVEEETNTIAIPNDGSFLEQMKKKLEQDGSLPKPNGKKRPAGDMTQVDDDPAMLPPAAKRPAALEIIDEDDEGPMLPPGFQ